MTNATPPLPDTPERKSCLGRVVVFLVRFTFILLIGVLVGAAAYYGAIWVSGQYNLVTENHEDRLAELELNQAEAEQLIPVRFDNLTARVETLEVQGDTQKDSLADIENQLSLQGDEIAAQADTDAVLQASQDGIQETILSIQTELGIIGTDLEAIQSTLTTFQDDLTLLGTQVDSIISTVEADQGVAEEAAAALVANETTMQALQNQMTILQAMQYLTRARLNLVQGNATLAQSDLLAAQEILEAAQPILPGYQAVFLNEVVTILDEALSLLPDSPLNAADVLETAWQMLAQGLPEEPGPAGEADQESTTEEEDKPTPTPTPEP